VYVIVVDLHVAVELHVVLVLGFVAQVLVGFHSGLVFESSVVEVGERELLVRPPSVDGLGVDPLEVGHVVVKVAQHELEEAAVDALVFIHFVHEGVEEFGVGGVFAHVDVEHAQHVVLLEVEFGRATLRTQVEEQPVFVGAQNELARRVVAHEDRHARHVSALRLILFVLAVLGDHRNGLLLEVFADVGLQGGIHVGYHQNVEFEAVREHLHDVLQYCLTVALVEQLLEVEQELLFPRSLHQPLHPCRLPKIGETFHFRFNLLVELFEEVVPFVFGGFHFLQSTDNLGHIN